jgi:hypothetical protein
MTTELATDETTTTVCEACGHQHAGPELGGICVGCPCEETPDPARAVIDPESEHMRSAAVRIEASVERMETGLQILAKNVDKILARLGTAPTKPRAKPAPKPAEKPKTRKRYASPATVAEARAAKARARANRP